MKFQLLPSTFDESGAASARQHLTCFIVDDLVAFDAGSLAMSVSGKQRAQIRDVVLTHAHLDHIAGLPLFIDDLFARLSEPIRVHASPEAIDVLERDVFNWSVYPRFSELSNDNGAVMEYRPFDVNEEFSVKHLRIRAINVNHKVPTTGFIVSDGAAKFALTGDTAEMDEFWAVVNSEEDLSAILVECAFPNDLSELAEIAHHLTPSTLAAELAKFNNQKCPVYVINLKPMYREQVIEGIMELDLPNVQILEVGKVYEW